LLIEDCSISIGSQQSEIDNVMELKVIQPGRPEPGEPPVFNKIGIVGLGLIGGSIALASRQRWPSALVIGVDCKDTLETAMRLHAIDVAADDLFVLAEADVVILAAPVRQNISLLERLDEAVQQPAVVTDTGSTKRAMFDAAKQLPPRFAFVGGHPLGGSAKGGLEHARPDLFSGRPWLLTPVGDGAGEAVEKLSAFARALGAEPRMLSAAAHDQLLAYLSHLPQLTASALMQVIGDAVGEDGLTLAGRGLVDTTRLAASPAGIWQDIAATNADELGHALDALISVLRDLRSDLERGERLNDVFMAANRWRKELTNGETR
jgi:prephenate dehydrogenase